MIARDLAAATSRDFDLIVVGGGIHGVSLLREATRSGLAACLCEAADFGGATSWNSLRIVHGGLRYLQTVDLARFAQSVEARRRMALQFPALVRPLRFLMPLYGRGLRRPAIMRLALLANDALSARRNVGIESRVHLPDGEVLDPAATRHRFPQVRADGLRGAACWSDYFMLSSERILIELLHDACRGGAIALNYAPVTGLLVEGGAVAGVQVRDASSDEQLTIRGRTIVNCAGSRVRDLVRGQGADVAKLFRPSLAFNLLLDLQLQSDCALAVAPPGDTPVLFLVPQAGGVLAGTMHLPRPVDTDRAAPTAQEIESFLALLNAAIPGMNARPANVRRVFAGLLPAASAGSSELARRAVIESHARRGGPRGLFSLAGIKFTTAGEVARELLRRMEVSTRDGLEETALHLAPETPLLTDAAQLHSPDTGSLAPALQRVADTESVRCLEDLILRRSNWGVASHDLEQLTAVVARWLPLPLRSPGADNATEVSCRS